MNTQANNQISIKQAIELEYLRHNLSQNKNFDQLVETYKSGRREIPDLNTSDMWSTINRKGITFKENPMAFDRINSVVSLVKGNNIKILDIGFGQGLFEDLIDKKIDKCDLWGIDMASATVSDIQRKYIKRKWKFIEGNISETKLPREYFDLIVALEVLEHIQPRNIFKVLSKIYLALKQGGKFIVSVPLNEGLEAMLFCGKNPNAHTRIYTPDLIKSELIVSGLTPKYEKVLYAFNSQYYIKSLICKLIPGIRLPNNIVIEATK